MFKIKIQPDVIIEGVDKPISMKDWIKTCVECHLPFGKGYANIKKADRIMEALNPAPPVDGSVRLDLGTIDLNRNDFDELYNAVQALDMKPKIALAVKSFYEAVEKAKD